eukprot:gene7523-7733_t
MDNLGNTLAHLLLLRGFRLGVPLKKKVLDHQLVLYINQLDEMDFHHLDLIDHTLLKEQLINQSILDERGGVNENGEHVYPTIVRYGQDVDKEVSVVHKVWIGKVAGGRVFSTLSGTRSETFLALVRKFSQVYIDEASHAVEAAAADTPPPRPDVIRSAT